MRYTTTFSADGSNLLCKAVKAANVTNWLGSFMAGGGFGGGTLTMQVSPDGGVTKHTVKDVNGALVSLTAAGMFTAPLGNGSTNANDLEVYATLTGATGPTLSVQLYDNR